MLLFFNSILASSEKEPCSFHKQSITMLKPLKRVHSQANVVQKVCKGCQRSSVYLESSLHGM